MAKSAEAAVIDLSSGLQFVLLLNPCQHKEPTGTIIPLRGNIQGSLKMYYME